MAQALTLTPAKTSTVWPWAVIFGRLFAFAAFQALFAIGYALSGAASPWQAAAAWWPFTVALTNALYLVVLTRLFRAEGRSFWQIFRVQLQHLRSDLLALLGLMVILGPVSYLPNLLLGGWLFGNPQATLDFLVRPLPLWAVYLALVVFPLGQSLAELPTYFLYGAPRLEAQGLSRWQAVSVTSLLLGFQHLAAPLVFDTRYLLWRALMFVPFAFLAGITLRWRPRLLPYMALVHWLMDLLFAAMLLGVAY